MPVAHTMARAVACATGMHGEARARPAHGGHAHGPPHQQGVALLVLREVVNHGDAGGKAFRYRA